MDRRGGAVEPGMPPQPIGDRQRVDLDPLPPCSFVTRPVQFAVVDPAKRDGELVANFAAERPRLGKTQMVGIGRRPAADHAGLRRHELAVVLVAQPDGLG